MTALPDNKEGIPRGTASDYETAFAQLREMGKRGWRFSVSFDGAMVSDMSGNAGDCNCPYPKEYDPSDGHGWSVFDPTDGAKHIDGVWTVGPIAAEWFALVDGEEEGIVVEEGCAFVKAVDFMHRHIMKVVPGSAR